MPKAIDVDEKHNEFVQASVTVIAAEGLSAATLRKISQYAGCTTGALTHYFPNRQQLLIDTLRHVHNRAGARMRTIAEQTAHPRQQLREVVNESLPLDHKRYEEWRVWLAFWGASMDDADLARENARRYKTWSNTLRTLLTRLLPQGVGADTIDLETHRLVALIDGLGVSVARERPNSSALAARRAVCQMVIANHLEELAQRI